MDDLQKIAAATRRDAFRAAAIARRCGVRLPKIAAAPKAGGLLSSSLSSTWRVGGTPPGPETTKPKWGAHVKAQSQGLPKPPSNKAYHHDVLESLYNPGRGFRVATGT